MENDADGPTASDGVWVDGCRHWHHGGSRSWCHLSSADTELLHAFARNLGLRRSWYHEGAWPHYDLVPSQRARAVTLGAEEVTARDLVRRLRAAGYGRTVSRTALEAATARTHWACRAWASSRDPLAENQARDGGAEDLGGFCGEASSVLVRLLAAGGIRSRLVVGTFGYPDDRELRPRLPLSEAGHAWVECSSFLLDPTAGQFPGTETGRPGWRVLAADEPGRECYRSGRTVFPADPDGIPWFDPEERRVLGLDPEAPRKRASAVLLRLRLPTDWESSPAK